MMYVLAGFGVGILGGLFGVGGAEMIIPLLVFGFAQLRRYHLFLLEDRRLAFRGGESLLTSKDPKAY
jgi:hypothetical protein